MARTCVYIVGILVICCWAAIAQAENMKYKDPNQPISVRIKDLLNRMTLEEKIGQMTQVERSVASTEVMKNFFIGNLHYHHPYLCLL